MKKTIFIALCLLCATSSASAGSDERVKETKLSDEEHFEGEEHNVDYDHEAFLGDRAEEFNQLSPEESKERLAELVPQIDTDGDGSITPEEMTGWIRAAQHRYEEEEVDRQWAAHAPEGAQQKAHLSWEDYQQTTYGGEPDSEADTATEYQRMVTRDRRRWEAADQDGDGQLSRVEFSTFLRPEQIEHMQEVVVLETMDDMDRDADGQISIDEYIGDMYDSDADAAAGAEEPEWVQHEREMFRSERDADGNGYLDAAEVKAWIMPADYDHAVAESQHLIHEADTDRDGALSADEILDNYQLFVGSQATDFGSMLTQHEEL